MSVPIAFFKSIELWPQENANSRGGWTVGLYVEVLSEGSWFILVTRTLMETTSSSMVSSRAFQRSMSKFRSRWLDCMTSTSATFALGKDTIFWQKGGSEPLSCMKIVGDIDEQSIHPILMFSNQTDLEFPIATDDLSKRNVRVIVRRVVSYGLLNTYFDGVHHVRRNLIFPWVLKCKVFWSRVQTRRQLRHEGQRLDDR